ncbi:FAD-dependent oxidoreductase [Nocardia sp. NPDC004068]|uniref:FAD-dependent oxidoreductase n=1 Tax=Nocardia sp. NPDC004068 TaxID=3364303 RepID=UPI003695B482
MVYEIHEPRVVIVGGGLVGLSAALFLRYHGVAVTLVERRVTTSPQPKARRVNIRTMELFRQIGIAEEVFAAAADLAEFQAMAAGPTLAEAERLPFTLPGGVPEWDTITPTAACLCAQDTLEPVLRRLGEERGADIRFGVECVEFTEDATGLHVTLRSADGSMSVMRAAWLIAADGAASPIRRRLGIARSGRGSLGRAVNVYFRADLSDAVRGREFNLCQIENPVTPGAFLSVDGRYRWIFSTAVDIDRPADDWAEVVREALGVPDAHPEILSVLTWEPGMFVADAYRSGRVFLTGDAAHVMPPYAAAGANTGIQDAHNLSWKLGWVLRGDANPTLLDSYHTERHPTGWHIADQSSIRTPDLRRMTTDSTDGTPLADPIALILGTRYATGALVPDGSPHTMTRLDLHGQPGTRLPHRFSTDGRSTLDLIGTDFVLLTGPDGEAWQSARQSVHVHALDESWCYTVDVERSGAVLVRPDQIIAWRVETLPHDPGGAVRHVLGDVTSAHRR